MTRNHVSIGGFAVSRIQDTAFADDLQPDAATDALFLWPHNQPMAASYWFNV